MCLIIGRMYNTPFDTYIYRKITLNEFITLPTPNFFLFFSGFFRFFLSSPNVTQKNIIWILYLRPYRVNIVSMVLIGLIVSMECCYVLLVYKHLPQLSPQGQCAISVQALTSTIPSKTFKDSWGTVGGICPTGTTNKFSRGPGIWHSNTRLQAANTCKQALPPSPIWTYLLIHYQLIT